MKTKIISKLKKELMLIELPEGWIFNIYKDQIGFCNEINKPMEQIKGSYTLLGKPDEIKGKDVKHLIDATELSIKLNSKKYKYRAYDSQLGYKTALESFNSALESEIYWNVNPLEEPNIGACDCPVCQDYFNDKQSGWNEVQEKTFDRNRSIILVKN